MPQPQASRHQQASPHFGIALVLAMSMALGRAPVLLAGLAIFSLASALISQVATNESLLILRAVQAFGGGWVAVCVPAAASVWLLLPAMMITVGGGVGAGRLLVAVPAIGMDQQ